MLASKRKKKCLKGGPIYVPEQWMPIISLARKGEPYKVNKMGTEDMLDFKKLCSEIGNNFTMNTDSEKVIWGKIKVLEARKNSPYKLFYKNEFSEKEFKTIAVREVASRVRRPKALGENLNLQQAYSKPPGISVQKKKDLISLCEANCIPNYYKTFYNNLNTNNGQNTEEVDVVDE